MCVCCNPGSMDLERLRPLKHLWGTTEQQYGSPSGTNSPRSCTHSPDQWNWSSLHTLFSRTAATDSNLPPPLPCSTSSPLLGPHYTCLFTWLHVQGETGAGSVYQCAFVCGVWCVWTGAAPSGQSLRLSLCTGRSAAMLMLMHSQWPQLGSQSCASLVATPLQLKTEGCLFGVVWTGLGYPGPCGEQVHISRGKQTQRTNCAYIEVLRKSHSWFEWFVDWRSFIPWLWFNAA